MVIFSFPQLSLVVLSRSSNIVDMILSVEIQFCILICHFQFYHMFTFQWYSNDSLCLCNYSDGGRSNSSSIFISGFVLGGLIVGTLGAVYAPQVSTHRLWLFYANAYMIIILYCATLYLCYSSINYYQLLKCVYFKTNELPTLKFMQVYTMYLTNLPWLGSVICKFCCLWATEFTLLDGLLH